MPIATPGSTPRTAATRRAPWFDVRLAIGIALVVASVVGVYAVVQAADRTTDVYSAKAALSAGDSVRAADLVVTAVRLGNADTLYLSGTDLPTDGLVVTRSVAAGELIPVSAVGTVSGITDTSVVVSLNGQLAESIRVGALVDVWASPAVEQGRFGPPTVVIASATVLGISEQAGIMARSGSAVEILIPKTKVATALESIANADAISLIPISRTLGK